MRHLHDPKVQQRAARIVVGGRYLGSCLKCTPQCHGHGIHFTSLLGACEAPDAKSLRTWRRPVAAAGSLALAANTAVLALSQPRLGTDAAQPTQPHRAVGSRRHAHRARGRTEAELTASDGRHTPCIRLVRTHGSPHASPEELHTARIRRAAVEAQAAVRGIGTSAAGLHRVQRRVGARDGAHGGDQQRGRPAAHYGAQGAHGPGSRRRERSRRALRRQRRARLEISELRGAI